MAEAIYQALNGLGLDGIILLVLAFLAVLFVSGLWSERIRRIAPAVMTSLGILGTFCGIYIALYPLDFSSREAIDEGIGALLDGMRTAFVTSLLGIFFAITFRVSSVFWSRSPGNEKDAEDSAPEEQRAILNKLDAIKQAIAGSSNSSVIEKIVGNSNSNVVEKIDEMLNENRNGFQKLDGLAATIREALVDNLKGLTDEIRNTIGDQLTNHLRQLVDELREMLNERFGKTFTEFNEAVQAIRQWQENHAKQVEQLTVAFDKAAEGITVIAAECEKIPPTMQQLQEVVGVAHANVEELNRQVAAFAGMREQAEQSFPVIKKHLDDIGADLSSSADGFKGLEKTIKTAFANMERDAKTAAEQHADSMRKMSADMSEALDAARREVQNIAEQHAQNVVSITATMRETLEKAQSDAAGKIAGIVEEAAAKFSQDMEREINQLTEAWGGNLVSVAQKAQEAINAVNSDQPER